MTAEVIGMAEWAWVAAGYITAYGAMAGYLLRLRLQRDRLRRGLDRTS